MQDQCCLPLCYWLELNALVMNWKKKGQRSVDVSLPTGGGVRSLCLREYKKLSSRLARSALDRARL